MLSRAIYEPPWALLTFWSILIQTRYIKKNKNIRSFACVCVCVWGGGGGLLRPAWIRHGDRSHIKYLSPSFHHQPSYRPNHKYSLDSPGTIVTKFHVVMPENIYIWHNFALLGNNTELTKRIIIENGICTACYALVSPGQALYWWRHCRRERWSSRRQWNYMIVFWLISVCSWFLIRLCSINAC